MKICSKKESTKFPPIEGDPVPGRVYQVKSDGDIYIGSVHEDLVDLSNGDVWMAGKGFDGDQADFRDVTDYVCIDTSKLPPLDE